MAWKLVYTSGAVRREYPLPDGPSVLGRDPACAIHLPDEPKASKQHARIEVRGEGVEVEDLQSRNGTRVNGDPVERKALEEGDILQVGSTSLRLVRDAAAAARDSGTARLVVVAGSPERELMLASSAVTLGASADNDLVLEGRGVSQVHAEVLLSGDGWLLHDLGSTNGTWVRGIRVEEQALSPGDEIVLGEVVLRFETGRPAAPGTRWTLVAAASLGALLLIGLAWLLARHPEPEEPMGPAREEASVDAAWDLALIEDSRAFDRAEAMLRVLGKGGKPPEGADLVEDFIELECQRDGNVWAVDWEGLQKGYAKLGEAPSGRLPARIKTVVEGRVALCLQKIERKKTFARAKDLVAAGRTQDAISMLEEILEDEEFGPSARARVESLRTGGVDAALAEAALLESQENWAEAIDRLELAGGLGAEVGARLEAARREAEALGIMMRLRRAAADGKADEAAALAVGVPAASRYSREAQAIAARLALERRLDGARRAFAQGRGREALAELEGLAGDEAASLASRVRQVVEAFERAERDELGMEPEQALSLWNGLLGMVTEEGHAYRIRALKGVSDAREAMKRKAAELAESFGFYLAQDDPAAAFDKLRVLEAMPPEFSAVSMEACRSVLRDRADELYRLHHTRLGKGELKRDPELRRQARAAFALLAGYLPEEHPRRERARAALEQVGE